VIRTREYLLEALIKRGKKVRVLVRDSLFRSEGVKLIYGDLLDKGSLIKTSL
jgi:uncharacterized protein YbjT (DUF2867 family)